jgi:uncharacterized RDD family membrane protein YckC
MSNHILPKEFPQLEESIYGAFWPRIGAFFLDFFIILPFSLGIAYLEGMSQQWHMVALGLQLLIAVLFYIIFIRFYGATPGKHIVGLKIIKSDGTLVGWNEAVLRSIVDLAIALFGLFITHMAIMSMTDEAYQALSFMTRAAELQKSNPELFQIQGLMALGWMLSEYIVLLFNKRRRGLNDFIGETLVIKSKYEKLALEYSQNPTEA